MFAGTNPKDAEQNKVTGKNNIEAAKAAKYKFWLEGQSMSLGYTNDWIIDFEEKI